MEKELSLWFLWELFWKKKVPLLVITLLVFGGLCMLSMATYRPQYTSEAILYVLHREETADSSESYNQFSLALKTVDDCMYFLKSRTVLEAVREELELTWTYQQLADRITVKNPENTRILEVAVTADSPEQAKEIVDTLCRTGQETIRKVMGHCPISLFENGRLEAEPSNDRKLFLCAMGGIAAGVLLYTVFLAINLLKQPETEKIMGE